MPGTIILEGVDLVGSGEVGDVIIRVRDLQSFYLPIRGTLSVESNATDITIHNIISNPGGVAVDYSLTNLGTAPFARLQLGFDTEGDILLTAVNDRLYLERNESLSGRVFFGDGDDFFYASGASEGRILAGSGDDTIQFVDPTFGYEGIHTGRIFLQSGDDLATGALPSPNQIYGGAALVPMSL